MSEKLFEAQNWTATKDVLLEGLNGNKKAVMETVLENTKKNIMESASAGATQAGNVAVLNKVILPVIRRVMPTVIANEIVGVQPMTGPVGQIHTLRVRYAETFAGVTAGSEALSPFNIAKAYSGNGNASAPAADSTSTMEGTPGKKLSIQVLKQQLKLRHVRCLLAGHLKLLKTHNPCMVWTLKQKSWQLWHKKLLLKSTKNC
jgi:hypothetical protein